MTALALRDYDDVNNTTLVCVCVRERPRETEREKERKKERKARKKEWMNE